MIGRDERNRVFQKGDGEMKENVDSWIIKLLKLLSY